MLVNIGVIILRRTKPDMDAAVPHPVRPGVPDHRRRCRVCLMKDLPATTWIRFVVWLGVGLVIYAAYGYRHSRLRERDSETVA